MVSAVVRFYEAIIRAGDSFQSVLLFIMRLYWGFAFYQTGMGKFHNLPQVAQYFQSLNVPFAEATAYLVASLEVGGGLLLMVGLASRLVSIPLIAVLCTAYATAHRAAVLNIFQDPDTFISQPPFNFLILCLLVFSFGPGKCSIDYLFQSKKG